MAVNSMYCLNHVLYCKFNSFNPFKKSVVFLNKRIILVQLLLTVIDNLFQPMMPPYGAPYAAIYAHGGVYAHPGVPIVSMHFFCC